MIKYLLIVYLNLFIKRKQQFICVESKYYSFDCKLFCPKNSQSQIPLSRPSTSHARHFFYQRSVGTYNFALPSENNEHSVVTENNEHSVVTVVGSHSIWSINKKNDRIIDLSFLTSEEMCCSKEHGNKIE